MANWLCTACAVEYPEGDAPPAACPICDDDRQYVPRSGQSWTTLQQLSADGCRLITEELEPDLFGVTTQPRAGIGQHSLLVRTAEGNLLWDPVGFVDEDGAQQIRELGGAQFIAASHPHMFGAQLSWARALGGAQVLVSEADQEWVQRTGPEIRLWSGDLGILPGVTLHTIGGHFPGSAVARWATGADGRGVLFTGDTIFPGPDGRTVSFMRSFPNKIPLSGTVVDRVATRVSTLAFDRIYGNFGDTVDADARAIIRRSADRYIAWVRGDFDHLT